MTIKANVAFIDRPPAQAAPPKLPALATSDLCSEFYNEPRVHDLLLAERRGFKRGTDIRELIARNKAELETFGAIIRQDAMNAGPATSPTTNLPYGTVKSDGTPVATRATARRGRPTKEYWLNEGQALLLCALARTTAAARIRRELVAVFMAYRHGDLVAPIHIQPDVADLDVMGKTLAAMKAEIAALRRVVASAVELGREQARALEIAASANPRRLNAPRPAKAIPRSSAMASSTGLAFA